MTTDNILESSQSRSKPDVMHGVVVLLISTDGLQASHGANALIKDFLGVREGESLLLTADTATDAVAIEAILIAAAGVGAKATVAIMPQLPLQGALADPYIPELVAVAARNCDVWLDIAFPYFAGSHVHDEAMKSERVRFVMITGLDGAGLTRIYGNADLDLLYEVQKSFDEIAAAALGKGCRITTQDGTDLSFTIAQPGYTKPRRAEKPGMYTPPGSAVFFPEVDSVRGQAVIRSRFHEYYAPRPSPITIAVDGKITDVRGGGTDYFAMDRALRRAGGGEYGYVIHFTHGFHPATRAGECLLEDIRMPGNDAVGLGLPWWVPGGGGNHPDGIINMQSIWIDGEQIVKDGDFVSPPSLAKLGEELRPLYR